MSFPSSTTVLVVGAGPAGMACALSLWYSGVKDITIVDAVHQDDHTSRAIVIHAATLEVRVLCRLSAYSHLMLLKALDTIGCADEIVNRGITTTSIDYFDRNNNLLLGADFNGLIGKTRFPFYILLPQHITEEILGNKLKEVGISIFRPYKAVGMHQSSKASGAADVSFENGESITAKYVIGADGIHSPVRFFLNLLHYHYNSNRGLRYGKNAG
jgi:2-polyprenyl-6-methoxyphenol hydroxylase-like FAD-dependent oxidoreductase